MKKEMQQIDPKRPVYTIGVVSELVGLCPRTLRFYEEVGLIRPARSRGNIRLYSQYDVEVLRRIVYLTQELKVNLAGVRVILQMEEFRRSVVTGEPFLPDEE